MLLVLGGDPRKQRIVITWVLVRIIVSHEKQNDFLHIDFLVHLEGASIDNFVNSRLARPRVLSILGNVVVHLIRKIMALLKALMIRADENDAEV